MMLVSVIERKKRRNKIITGENVWTNGRMVSIAWHRASQRQAPRYRIPTSLWGSWVSHPKICHQDIRRGSGREI